MNTRTPQNWNHMAKILIIGDSRVGKSSLMLRFTDNTFSEAHGTTIGVGFGIKSIDLIDRRITLQIWDTVGQERFRKITTAFFRGAQGIILAYDVTNKSTFVNVDTWLQDIERHCSPGMVNKILVGTKCDLESERQVSYEEGLQKADQNGMKFFEVSARTSTNVEAAFDCLVFGTLRLGRNDLSESLENVREEGKLKKLSLDENEIIKYATCC